MPRLPASIQRQATRQDKFLRPLLNQTRDLDSAQNELRWLRDHARKDATTALNPPPVPWQPISGAAPLNNDDARLSKLRAHEAKSLKLEALVRRRAAGEPLQYILGDQPFGDLEILCEPNVLIPRVETETYTASLVRALIDTSIIGERFNGTFARNRLRILDICTGSGAIALLLHQLLRQKFYGKSDEHTAEQQKHASPLDLQILGIDISLHATRLARKNLSHNLQRQLLHHSAEREVIFRDIDATKLGLALGGCKQELGNLVGPTDWAHGANWDVVICNPPYVAPDDYAVGGRTEKSVRDYEPQLALVPPPGEDAHIHPGDTFYPHIIRIARRSGAALLVMEVGDAAQAARVRKMVRHTKLSKAGFPYVETWHDDGTVIPDEATENLRGTSSNARAVVVWRDKWSKQRRALFNPPVRRINSQQSESSLEMSLRRHSNRSTRWKLAEAKKQTPVSSAGN